MANLVRVGCFGGGSPVGPVPDGRTVTPINDVILLQKCAGISSPAYTDLSDLMADTGVLLKVINSDNAIDYLVRSTAFAKSEALVPTMTSDTTPSGVAFCTDVKSQYPPFQAFDRNDTSIAVSSNTTQSSGLYIGYEFTNPVKAHYCNFICSNAEVATLKCEASDDNTMWETVSANTTTVQNTSVSLQLTPTKAYKYYRLYQISVNPANSFNFKTIQFYNVAEGITDNSVAMSYIGACDYASNTLLANATWCDAICNSTYAESVLNVSVPTMTSNTTPSGECFSKSNASTSESGPAYYAFNGNSSLKAGSAANDGINWYVGYDFKSSYVCIKSDVQNIPSSSTVYLGTYKIQGSIDNIEWVDLTDTISAKTDGTIQNVVYTKNISLYQYYRLLSLTYGSQSASNKYARVATLQFYGRQNGGVQTWLKSAGITNKSYVTLGEVLSDTTTLTALIASHDAMNYLVQCTSWASTICADQTAMQYIGNNNYAADTLLDNSIWCNAICNSTYMEDVLNVKVPIMTSSTTPYGEVTGSLGNSWMAFDGDSSTRSSNSAWMYQNDKYTGWVQYDFTTSKNVRYISISGGNANKLALVSAYSLQGSDDNTNFTDIDMIRDYGRNTVTAKIFFDNTNTYRYYKLTYVLKPDLNISGTGGNLTLGDTQFYGRKDIIDNPVTIYSAANDTVYYVENGNNVTLCTTDASGQGIADKTALIGKTVTLYSSVAKDPNNLSNLYTKSVTVSAATAEIKVMPDNVLYWWGNKLANMQGYAIVYETYGTPTAPTITYNARSIGLSESSGGKRGVYATSSKVDLSGSTKMNFILGNGTIASDGGFSMVLLDNVTSNFSGYDLLVPGGTTLNTLTHIQKNINVTDKHVGVFLVGGQTTSSTSTMHAIWYE